MFVSSLWIFSELDHYKNKTHWFLCKMCFSSHPSYPYWCYENSLLQPRLSYEKSFCLCLTPPPLTSLLSTWAQIQRIGSQVCFLAHLPFVVTPAIVLGNARFIFHQDYWIIFFQEKWKRDFYLEPLPVNESKGKSISNRLPLCWVFPLGRVPVLGIRLDDTWGEELPLYEAAKLLPQASFF